jgi:hypothetical protein
MRNSKGLGKKDLSQSCLSFDPAAALLRAVNILDIPHSKRLASGPNDGAIFGQIFFSEALSISFRGPESTNDMLRIDSLHIFQPK